MKKRIATKIALLAMAVALVAATPQPLTVLNTLTELLDKPPRYGEAILILGETAAFDTSIRLAKHFTNAAYATNGTTVFPAIGGGIWYLTTLITTTTTPSVPVESLAITCADDSTDHDLIVESVLGYYLLSVDQSVTSDSPTAKYIESSDGTSHKLTVRKDPQSGTYSIGVMQANSAVEASKLTLIASDTSEHSVSITNYGGTHILIVTQ